MKKSLKHNLTRIAFTEAILKARDCNQEPECPCEFCVDLVEVSASCGITFNFDGDRHLTHALPDLVESKWRDALEMLSIQNSFKLYRGSNIFSGFMELPEGAYPAYQYFSENNDEYSSDENMLKKRQTAFILATQALPDSYLSHIEEQKDVNHSEIVETPWEQCCRVFREIDMPILDLPKSITSNISPDCFWTEHFAESGCLNPVAGYGLEFGHFGKDLSSDNSISLKDYVDVWPSIPDYFSWSDNTNQAGTCGGFVVRTSGLLVSQQWFFGDQNDLYINAFNHLVSPLLETEPENGFDHVIVVYSAYRNDAYIASTDPRSWDPLTPSDRLLLPLPSGYGLVGNWRETDGDYSPPPLSTFKSNLYTPKLRAASQYLEECLNIERERFGMLHSD
jgi:hypothetical protein